MRIERLTLQGFRSYASVELTIPPGPQVVVGDNAAGKTNLLEALVVLGTGGSHRAAPDPELIAWNAPFARIEAAVDDPGRQADVIEVVLQRAGSGNGRRRARVNGVPRRTTALSGVLRVVVFAPEEMLLISGAPSLRRTELDTLIRQRHPDGGTTLATYARALQQRNNLLRTIREGLAEREELDYWDDVLCREGARLVSWRLETLAALSQPLAEAHAEIAPAEGILSLRYLTNAPAAGDESREAALRRRLAETAEKELWNGVTLVGPHRDDVAFELAARDVSTFGSRGQQRTAILALKLAELDLLTAVDGRPPLLLLDDVFSELDPQRRAHLVRRIALLPQAFVTTTTLHDLDAALVDNSTAWHVTPGSLRRAEHVARGRGSS